MTRFVNAVICAAAVAVACDTPLAAQDKAAEVIKQMREALGGDKLAQLKTLTLEGPFGREMGPRQMQGTIVLTLQMPDRMHRSEEVEMPGGMSLERVSALAGETAWEDMQNRGGMAGGMQIVMRGPGGTELNPEQLEQAPMLFTWTAVALFASAILCALLVVPIRRMMTNIDTTGARAA